MCPMPVRNSSELKPLKICHVASCFPPSRGGVETFVYNLCKRLVEKGHRVKVITSDRGKSSGKYHEWIDGIEVIRFPERYHLFEAPIMPRIALRALREDYDVLHVHGMVPSVSDLALVVGFLRRKPKVITYHYDAVTPKYGVIGRLTGVVYAGFAGIILKLADVVVATTRSYARTSPVLGNTWEKAVIIPCGVDTSKFSPNQSQESRSATSTTEDHSVLYVGKLIHYKGVDNLIRAFQLVLEKCPNCRLTIAGNGDEREELMQLSSELGLGGKVVFAGDIPDQLLAQYYRDSDLLVLPSLESRREAFGMVLLEAMACGIPVIASDIPGPDEVVSNDENGLLTPPGDTAKLAEAIITILSDPRRAAMGGRALRGMKLEYDWSIIAGRYEDLYRSSVKQGAN